MFGHRYPQIPQRVLNGDCDTVSYSSRDCSKKTPTLQKGTCNRASDEFKGIPTSRQDTRPFLMNSVHLVFNMRILPALTSQRSPFDFSYCKLFASQTGRASWLSPHKRQITISVPDSFSLTWAAARVTTYLGILVWVEFSGCSVAVPCDALKDLCVQSGPESRWWFSIAANMTTGDESDDDKDDAVLYSTDDDKNDGEGVHISTIILVLLL